MAYGTVNADVVQSSVSGVSLGAGDATMMKNRIINGAMVIDQRNSGASITANNAAYPVDRFRMDCTQSSKGNCQQTPSATETGYATRVAAGFTNYFAFTSTSAYSVSSSDEFTITQNIEGYNIADLAWGTANAKTVTLSFLAYSSLTGTFGGSLQNSSNTRSYPFSYTISSANTWTTVSVTISGETSGTWLSTNGIGMRIFFSLGCGSTYSGTAGSWASSDIRSVTGATSVVGTNGATFYITGVQLEVGSSATGFEYRQYGTELALCQRYFQRYNNGRIATGGWTSGTSGDYFLPFVTQFRAVPSFVANANGQALRMGISWTNISSVTISSSESTPNFAFLAANTVSNPGAAVGDFTMIGGGGGSNPDYLFSSEL